MKMRLLTVLLALGLVVVACGDDDAVTTAAPTTTTATTTTSTTAAATTAPPTTAAPGTTSPSTTTLSGAPDLVIETVAFGETPYLAITNRGSGTASLDGHFLCQRPVYFALPALELAAGETVFVAATGSEPDVEGRVIVADGRIGPLNASSGEIGLYSGNGFGDPNQIVAYVEWGSADHGRSSVAVNAGIWTAGDFVVTEDATLLISLDGDPGSSAGWVQAVP